MSDACVVQFAIERHGLESRHSWKQSLFLLKDFKFLDFEFIWIIAIQEFKIVYEDTCRRRILSDTRLMILR